MKRKNEEMQGELSNLRQLYDFLRLRPEQEALEILRRIRNHTPGVTSSTQHIQELADFVRHGDLLIQPTINLPAQHCSNPGNAITLPPLRMALDSPNSDPYIYPHSLPMPGIFSVSPECPTPQRRRRTSDANVSARFVATCGMRRSPLANTSSDNQPSLPCPTSIEAIVHETRSPIMQSFSDPRLKSVRNWTTVTHDSDLLINIMTAWYNWEYKYFHFLDWDMFLDDMVNSQDEFCSELLVNSILASGSVSVRLNRVNRVLCLMKDSLIWQQFQSPMVGERSRPFADNSTTLFYKEARRLWELEEGRDTLLRLQSALCLFMVTSPCICPYVISF